MQQYVGSSLDWVDE
ncbi:hypothetical protein EYZ11_007026 [Aspergillus tanneri]|uniref:Uncharacterized protein n=1 Tax=Aspergillus tanneri TaxID=1220188 RepID=A0A4S3JEC2_9EURO|nr:hypothetical protein EYZ11_007026 [Aspergillus tanneri]